MGMLYSQSKLLNFVLILEGHKPSTHYLDK